MYEPFRFGVLLELQETKNVRISRFQSGEIITSDQEPGRASFRTRLDNFEALDVRILSWAEHILERLEDGLDKLDIGDKQLLYEETEAEVRNQQTQIFENIQEGEALIRGNYDNDFESLALANKYKFSRLRLEISVKRVCSLLQPF